VRILFCATPGGAHVRPLLPLLAALHRRGHTMAWAGAAETQATALGTAPLTPFEVGPGQAAARAELHARWPALAEATGPDADVVGVPRLFGAVMAPAMFEPLQLALRRFGPDLVVGETGALAAPLAARLAGCPHVCHGIGMPWSPQRLRDAAAAFAPAWLRSIGHPPPPHGGLHDHLHLDLYPASLQDPPPADGPTRLALRPAEAGLVATFAPPFLPNWWSSQDPRPLVCLTLGVDEHPPALMRSAISALAGMALRVVVTTGPHLDPAGLQPLPPNVHAAPFIPLQALLPHARLVVSHGGSGTQLAAWAHGLPQLALPQEPEQLVNADALQRSGAGLALRGRQQNVFTLREAVRRLLGEPRFAEQARRLAQEIAGMPGLDEVSAELEARTPRWQAALRGTAGARATTKSAAPPSSSS
jgi:UDP-N-acetylglucosamine:LPS N-acetylglucosamine transferase